MLESVVLWGSVLVLKFSGAGNIRRVVVMSTGLDRIDKIIFRGMMIIVIGGLGEARIWRCFSEPLSWEFC